METQIFLANTLQYNVPIKLNSLDLIEKTQATRLVAEAGRYVMAKSAFKRNLDLEG